MRSFQSALSIQHGLTEIVVVAPIAAIVVGRMTWRTRRSLDLLIDGLFSL